MVNSLVCPLPHATYEAVVDASSSAAIFTNFTKTKCQPQIEPQPHYLITFVIQYFNLKKSIA